MYQTAPINCLLLEILDETIRNNIVMDLVVHGALFKYTKLSNYSLKMSKFSISNALITQTFIKNYHLRSLTSARVNISLL